ncbi:ABC transporter ATP-binding protein [Anaerotignum sp.]|uniref:ABC transporter ATP-binding protein n=1 Tax=Anaerotignum sp. TaxID=2039241 RepID=UPI00289DA101|nr:ABC transporter ATP-binding protein [Anaerotignum sp.]
MEVSGLEFSYGKNKVLNKITFQIPKGKITTLIGANGCGKSTLFHVMTKNLKAQQGKIFLNGKNINEISLKQFAKEVSIVHQYNVAPNDLTVEKLIGYGRIAHGGLGKKNKQQDEKFIHWAMEITNVTELKDRRISDLSGGQRQRVWIAMALAQNTKILFLDEPTTYLDIRYQIEILKLLKRLNAEVGMTMLVVLHDINQAIQYSDEIIAMKEGKIIAQGNPREIATEKILKAVYDIDLKVENVNGNVFVLTV